VQHEQAHLRQYHPCNRERIHTSSNDRYRGALVTILGVEALVPSACRRKKRLHERTQEKIVTAQTACRSLPEEAKEYFAETK
jgi:hypothetical protein